MKKTMLVFSLVLLTLQISSPVFATLEDFVGTWDLYRQQGSTTRHFVMVIFPDPPSINEMGYFYEPSCYSYPAGLMKNCYIQRTYRDIYKPFGTWQITHMGTDLYLCYTMGADIFVSFQNDLNHISGRDLIGYYWTGTKREGTSTTTTTGNTDNIIKNHMMTGDPKPGSGCETPVSKNTFYDYDDAAYCWFYWEGSSNQDVIKWEWYNPNGDLFVEDSFQPPYTNGCTYPGMNISGYTPTPGEWRVDVYLNDIKNFTETFTIISQHVTSTTTTSPSTTTICSGPCCGLAIYGEYSEEVEILRYFRDNILSKTSEGRELIKLYYQWSPVIVRAMEADEVFKEDIKELIDEVLPMIGGEVE